MLTPAEADAAIAAHAPTLPAIPIALRDAPGCVLRQPVVAERDQPPFDRVAMDGIAVDSASTKRAFKIVGTQAAGAAPLALPTRDDCIEVMTGAMLPTGCDCVVPVERIVIRDGAAHLADDVQPTPWLNLHRRATDCRAGAALLQPGVRLRAPEVAVLASAGLRHVQVSRPPRIVVISTGDELVEPGTPLEPWQIRRSNVYGVMTSLRAHGYTRVADDHIADDRDVLRTRLRTHLSNADVLILSGGVSMGKFDYVPKILDELGVRQVFHRIAQRPGKPMWFGVLPKDDGGGTAVYALPGNPVSTLACMARYVLPGLAHSLQLERNLPPCVTLTGACPILPTMATLLPVRIARHSQLSHGTLAVDPQPTHGSGDFTSLVGAHGCVELPPGHGELAAGTTVRFYSW